MVVVAVALLIGAKLTALAPELPDARLAAFLAMLFLIAGLASIVTDQGRIDRVFVRIMLRTQHLPQRL